MSTGGTAATDDITLLHDPLYGASFVEAVRRFFRKYAVFTGRASRSEFWWAMLFQWIVGTIVGLILSVVVIGVAVSIVVGADRPDSVETVLTATVWSTAIMIVGTVIVTLPLLVPSIAVTVRRLHDTNRSGWLYLISLIPGGGYVVFVLAALETDPAGRRFDQQGSSAGAPVAGSIENPARR